eukprot:3040041-Pyramimonas_sp.AAC.1
MGGNMENSKRIATVPPPEVNFFPKLRIGQVRDITFRPSVPGQDSGLTIATVLNIAWAREAESHEDGERLGAIC